MTHPEGRVLAVQQQMFFATLLADRWDISEAIILRKLALAGLKLTPDDNEVAVDAAAIFPRLQDTKKPNLSVVEQGEQA